MTTLDKASEVIGQLVRTGNIGGILARTTASGSVFYGYDGGGNVVALTNNAGAEVGSYTYDAFGNTVATSGVAASENPYRFSTKEQIGGLYSYGLRFYSPGIGRWINRDPIGEAGGANLYGFVGNDPINSVDAYGLWGFKFGDGPNFGLGDPSLHFTGEGTVEGLKTGGSAVGSSFSFGLWDGGEYRCQAGFGTSKIFADIGRDSLLQAGGAGALKASPRFMSWWSRGAGEATAGAGSRGWYELGQLTLKDSAYAKVAHITDPIARGKEIWRLKLYKNIDVRKAFSRRAGGTFSSGPAPGARSFIKGAYLGTSIVGETLQGSDCGCQ